MDDIAKGDDNHTPDKYRLIGSLMLSDEFANDFNCPKNSTMYPERNCPIGSFWPNSPVEGKLTNFGKGTPTKQLKDSKLDKGKAMKEGNFAVKLEGNGLVFIVVLMTLHTL